MKPAFQKCVLKKLLPANRPESTARKDTIVGVNKYRLEKEDPIDILEVDNTAVRESQIERLEEIEGRTKQ